MTAAGNAPWRIKSSNCSGLEPNRRIDIAGPSRARGGMMALTRLPSVNRASTMGLVSSMRRPTRPTMRSMIWRRCWLSRNRTGTGSSRPLRLDVYAVGLVDQNIADGRIPSAGLSSGPQAEGFIHHIIHQPLLVGGA